LKKAILILIALFITETLQGGNFYLVTGPYIPSIKTKFVNSTGKEITYTDLYGKSGTYLTILHYDYALLKKFGELALGIETGFSMDRGRSLINDNGIFVKSGETLTMIMIPLNINLNYYLRLADWQPVVPFLKAGGSGFYFNEHKEKDGTTEGFKRGYYYAVGLEFLLDPLDPVSATNLKIDYGIENTYIIAGYRVFKVKTPQPGFDFSNSSWFAGINFNF